MTERVGAMGTQYAAAVLQGQSHFLEGLPCQDYAAGGAEGPVALVVLCDGAGSCPGSEAASECVCRWALEYIPVCFDTLYAMDTDSLAVELAAQGQNALAEAGLGNRLCTMLLFACHKDGRWLAAHIGDGYIFLRENGGVRVLSHPENGRFANETFFLCEPYAAKHLRTARGLASGQLQALLTSDGCGDCLYDRDARCPAPAVDVMCSWLAVYDSQIVSRAVAQQLEELFSLRSDDDLGIAILNFRPSL